jgi:hypothetical protein
MISIVNNILYTIDAFGTIQFLDKIKYICRCFFFFFLGKISCKTFKSENKSIPSRSKKLSSFKKLSRLT